MAIAQACTMANDSLRQAGFTPDYMEVRSAKTLANATDADSELVVLAAAQLGKARLIDNLCFKR